MHYIYIYIKKKTIIGRIKIIIFELLTGIT